MRTVLEMEEMDQARDGRQPAGTLPAHAALITAASRLNGAHKGWYFAVMVRAAYSRLEGVA